MQSEAATLQDEHSNSCSSCPSERDVGADSSTAAASGGSASGSLVLDAPRSDRGGLGLADGQGGSPHVTKASRPAFALRINLAACRYPVCELRRLRHVPSRFTQCAPPRHQACS